VPPPPLNVDATQKVVTQITSIPASELDAVGKGSANQLIKPVSGRCSRAPKHFLRCYTSARVLPLLRCREVADDHRAVTVRHFSGLKTTTSSSSDVYPNTPTFTFHGATYTSQYIDFVSVETTDRDRNPLESPTAAQQALVNQYDTSGSIPFVDFGNRYAFSGAMYLPDVLSGMSWQAVADTLCARLEPGESNPRIGQPHHGGGLPADVGSAASVCSSATIQALEKSLAR